MSDKQLEEFGTWYNANIDLYDSYHVALQSWQAAKAAQAYRIAKLEAKCAELDKDAARLAWLVKFAYVNECYTHSGTQLEICGTDRCVPIGGDVRIAIDAAIAK